MFIIGTALAMIEYTAQLFFSRAKLLHLLLFGNAGKLRYLPFIILVFFSDIRNSIFISIYKLVYFDALYHLFYLFIYLSQTQKRPYMYTHAKKKKKEKEISTLKDAQ